MGAYVRGLALFALACATTAHAENCPLPEPLWDNYFRAHREGNVVHAAVGLSKISRRLFVDSASKATPLSTAQYRACLKRVEDLVTVEPEAALDLARALELRWESLYWTPFRREARIASEERCQKAGLSVGALAWGLTLWRRPQDVPRYFRYVRHFLPVAGLAAGKAASPLASATDETPEAPARLWKLPQVTHADELESRREMEELLAAASGIAVGAASYEILAAVPFVRAANLACTPLKVHPGVFVASLVLGFAAEEGLKASASAYDDWESTRALEESYRDFAVARARYDDFAIFIASEKILASTLRRVYRETRVAPNAASEARVQRLLRASVATLRSAAKDYLDPSIDYLRAFEARWEAL